MEYLEIFAIISNDVKELLPAYHVNLSKPHAFGRHSWGLAREELVEPKRIACF